MKKIRILLDYHCYPLWIYDEDGDLIDPMLPEELESNQTIIDLLDEIERIHDSLFIDTKNEFRAVGFQNRDDEIAFANKISLAYRLLQEAIGDIYIIVNDTHYGEGSDHKSELEKVSCQELQSAEDNDAYSV